jgi:hypothetical protein
MNSIIQFKKKENLNLLLEVLLDELEISSENKRLVSNIKTIFESNINPFINKANPQNNLVDLNKLFLKQVSIAINRLMPNIKQETNVKKITIIDEELSQPYTIEDIQAVRQSEFDKKLQQQKLDFENIINPKKPQEVNFSYEDKESKITEMEHLIADTIARRKYELDEIQNKNYTELERAENWLTPKETSNKNDKVNQNEEENYVQQKLKHISIGPENMPDNISPKKQKNVSWSDNSTEQNTNKLTPNIFNKLKQKPINEMQKQYAIKNNFVDDNLQPVITPTPIIKRTNTENPTEIDMQNQLNVINKKIEDLQDMMKQIFRLLEHTNPSIPS